MGKVITSTTTGTSANLGIKTNGRQGQDEDDGGGGGGRVVNTAADDDDDENSNNTIAGPLFIRPGVQTVPNPGGIFTTKHGNGRPFLSKPTNIERLRRLMDTTAGEHQILGKDDTMTTTTDNIHFIYGMIFESLFTIHPSVMILPATTTTTTNNHRHHDNNHHNDPGRSSLRKSLPLWDFIPHPIDNNPTTMDSSSTSSSSNVSSTTTEETTNERKMSVGTTTASTSNNNNKKNKTIKSYFIHSRHPNTRLVEYTWPERLCLQMIFPQHEEGEATSSDGSSYIAGASDDESCHIWVMSDSNVTFPLLHHEISNLTKCSHSSQYTLAGAGEKAADEKKTRGRSTGTSFSTEHGPFAGRGYWEDVSQAIQARDGMVAFHQGKRAYGLPRTSTCLIRNVIEFRRRLEHIVQHAVDWSKMIKGSRRRRRRRRSGREEDNGDCGTTATTTTSFAGGGVGSSRPSSSDNADDNNNMAAAGGSVPMSFFFLKSNIPPLGPFDECLNPWKQVRIHNNTYH